jgi:hypothetical protein
MAVTSTTLSLTQIIYLAAAIVAVGGGALGLYGGALKIYRRTAGSRRDLAMRLGQLGAGVTVRWVEERFGTPAFARAFAPMEAAAEAAGSKPIRELVYRERHAWLQILADEAYWFGNPGTTSGSWYLIMTREPVRSISRSCGSDPARSGKAY